MNSWVLSFVLFWTGCIAPARPSPAPVQAVNVKSARPTTHRIAQVNMNEDTYCSATAVGPHALLTATHCEIGSDDISVDGRIVKIQGRIRDDLDHTIYLIRGMGFNAWIPIVQDVEFASGQSVHIWGNPGGERGLYRHGFYAGSTLAPAFNGTVQIPAYLFDMNIYRGDSGAGVFTDDGRLVGLISKIVTLGDGNFSTRFAVAFPFLFEEEQLKAATNYDGK
jgi:hypothetical protein